MTTTPTRRSINLAETDMAETDMAETDMTETDMTETDMTETDMTETDMTETDMTETDIAKSTTEHAASEHARDGVADLLRVGALGVVVVWHSTLSLFYRMPGGELSMPNMIGNYRGLWMLTWALQVMPLFFVVSGAVNASAWQRHRDRGGTAWGFSRRRVARFLVPVVVLLGICGAIDLVARVVFHTEFMSDHMVILVPLWTLGLLVAYAPATPWLDRAWERFGVTTTAALASVVILSDLIRFRSTSYPVTVAQVVSTAGVWLAAYQLGWVYRAAVRGGNAATRSAGHTLAIVGFVGLVVSTNIGVYPRSMVSTTTDTLSNLLPTTTPILMLAMFQCGLVLIFRPKLDRWVSSPDAGELLDKAGVYALPAYLFHMIAVVAAVVGAEALGITFLANPTTTWWLTRPAWLILVGLLMVPVLWASRRLLDRM